MAQSDMLAQKFILQNGRIVTILPTISRDRRREGRREWYRCRLAECRREVNTHLDRVTKDVSSESPREGWAWAWGFCLECYDELMRNFPIDEDRIGWHFVVYGMSAEEHLRRSEREARQKVKTGSKFGRLFASTRLRAALLAKAEKDKHVDKLLQDLSS